MKFYEINISGWLVALVYVLKSAAHFFVGQHRGKILNFSPLNLRMLNGKESIKAIKLIAPPKYTVNSLPQTCFSLFFPSH